MSKQVRRPNVKNGVLAPLGNGFALAIGKHPEKVDDIDIGPNNKNGLSVNHGEIIQQKGDSIRVFSAEPMIGGVSPTQLLYGGMAPDKVFAMQEQYKDVHGINDDGSRQHAKYGADNVPMYTDSEGNLIDSIQPSVVTAKLPAKFNGSQAAAARYAEGYKFGKKVAKKRNEIAPHFIPLVMGPLAPSAILSEMGGKSVDSLIQQATNYKKTGWGDAVTSFLDDGSKAKRIGKTIADFINPGYILGSIATPIKSSLINSNWKPSVKSKYNTLPSSIKNTLNINTEANKRLRDIIAKQVGNTTENPNRQKQVYNKALYYLGQAFDDVPENIQKDILNNTEILDNFITRVRWGEGKDMINHLKYEADKIGFKFRQNIAYQKRLNYRYKNVPSIFRNSELVNDTPVFQALTSQYGKHIANKSRYKLAQLLRNAGYTNFDIFDRNILSNIYDIAKGMDSKFKGYKPLIYIPNKNLTTNTKLNIIKFVNKYGIPKQVDPASGIKNKELQEIAKISPKYAGDIYANEQLGFTPEENINNILNKKWSFIRGINDYSGTLGIEDAKLTMSKIAENAKGGRADSQVFSSILPNEDIVYFSNSPTTAIAYTYPTQQGKGYIGIYRRKEPFIEGENLIDKWIKNQLPLDNILEAPSTVRKTIPQLEIPENRLKSFEIGLKQGINRGKRQGAGEADAYLYDLTKRRNIDSGYRHFLIKGNRGEQIPYLELKDIREVPKISTNMFSDKFDSLLKEFNVDPKDLNRSHNNKPSIYFSLGKKFGGQTNINSLGERPNVKYGKQMKNKRNKAIDGTQFNLSGLPSHSFNVQKYFEDYNLGTPFIPRYVDGHLKGHPILRTLRLPGTQTNFTPNTTSSDNNTPATSSTTKSNGFLGLGSAQWGNIGGTALQVAGSLGAAAINAHALDNLKFTPRQTTLLNPVKLKTKVNIAPQLAEINNTVAKVTDAANKTSASSRTRFQKIAAARYAGLESKSKLLGEKENKETALINQDRLNQQTVAHKNAERIREDINYNIVGKDNLHNQQTLGKASAWNSAINSISGAITGQNGFLDRIDARRQTATNLAAMSIAYPDAAKMLYGDGYKKYFSTYYDMLRKGGV